MLLKLVKQIKLTYAIVFSLIICLLMLIFFKKNNTDQVFPSPSPLPLTFPLVPAEPGPTSASYTNAIANPNNVSLPESINTAYSTSKEDLATKLGLATVEPRAITVGGNEDYYYVKDNVSLMISSKPNSLTATYKNPQKSSPPTLEISVANTVVLEYTRSVSLFPSEYTLKLISSEYQASEYGGAGKTTSISTANRTLLVYQCILNGIPVIINNNNRSCLEVVIDGNRTIQQLSFAAVPNIQNSVFIPTITQEEALSLLLQNKGITISISSSNNYEGELSPDYSSVVIKSIAPTYVYIPLNNIIVPGYIFEGTAKSTKQSGVLYQLSIVVPAIKS